MKVSVLGCGRWGGFIAWYLNKIGHEVCMWGRESSKNMAQIMSERKNSYVEFDERIELSTDLEYALARTDVVVISISAQQLRVLFKNVAKYDVSKKTFVLCMKGIEEGTGCRLSEIAEQELPEGTKVAIWVGPGHVQDYSRGIPNCMVIDSKDDDVKRFLVEAFTSELIRFYYGTDMIGNEIGAATKNVIGIAAGALDGLGYCSLKGALMARGTREVSRLIEAMGGDPMSAYGLAHLGDYEATVFSKHSRNRQFGESFVKGEHMEGLAEGVYTAKAMEEFGVKYGVELPICTAVNDIVNRGHNLNEVIAALFGRSIKSEF